MKTASAFTLALSIAFAAAPALADTMSSSLPMASPGHMGKPMCPANDPAVGVNMDTKMYMTAAQMKAKSAGMTADQVKAMMAKNHVSMMCTSKAEAMGAKPMAAAPAKM